MCTDSYMARCLRGECSAEDIDAVVARWHAGDDTRELHVVLGMTRAEYARWVADPSSLVQIIAAHAVREKVSV